MRIDLPLARIQQLESRSSGWRGLFLYGRHAVIRAQGLGAFQRVHFAERSSWLLPGSRKHARELFAALRKSLPAEPETAKKG